MAANKAPGKPRKVTAKQQRFVLEYLIDLNATQAAIRAGYSRKRASELGWQLLQNPTVQSAISASMAEREKRTQVDQDRVLLELARLGFSNVKRLFDERGNLLPLHELSDDVAASISSVKVKVEDDGETVLQVKEIKLWDKNSALEKVCKHLGLFAAEKTDVNLTGSVTIRSSVPEPAPLPPEFARGD